MTFAEIAKTKPNFKPIMVVAFEPHGDNAVGGHDWSYMDAPEFTGFMLDSMKQVMDGAKHSLEDGGFYNRFHIMFAMVEEGVANHIVSETLDESFPWLEVDRQEKIFTIERVEAK